jgi:hypothetical protein
MSSDWKQEYSKLVGFVSEHPEIKIIPNQISIPAGIREQFYALFNNVRTSVVRGSVGESLDESRNLILNYQNAEREVVRLFDLKGITSQTNLQRFLADFDDWLSRELFEPLFGLLKGTIDAQGFENLWAGIISNSVPAMYERAYGKWVAVSMIKLLEADELLAVPLPILRPRDRAGVGGKGVTEPVRLPQKSDHINFEYLLCQLFTAPDFIVHSAKLNKYIGIRTQYEDSLAEADNPSQAREWYRVDVMGDITSGMMLVYMADNPQDIAVVADRLNICRPDMIIECRTRKDWSLKESFDAIKLHNQGLKPVGGSFLMSAAELTDANKQELGEGIKVLSTEISDTNLQPIVDALASQAKTAEPQVLAK